MYDQEELRELIEILAEGRIEDYKAARRSFFPFVSARDVLAFADAYAERRLRKERWMADGLDWGAARAVLADLLWDFQCGRKPDVTKHIGRRTQTPSDIAWGTAASIATAALLPAFALYMFVTDPVSMFFVFFAAALFGPFSAAVAWSALRYQWNPVLRTVLWAEFFANALLTAVPAFVITAVIYGAFLVTSS